MPKLVKEKQALDVSRLSSPGMHAVGGVAGLYLQIPPPPSKSKTWILRVMVGGKRREIGLGGYPTVTLAGAKEAARAKRAMIEAGKDPLEEAKAAKSALIAARASAITFREAASQFIQAKEAGWKNAKHGQQWRNTLEQHAYPVLGKLLVRDISQEHVMKVLEPIWPSITETATRLRGRIENVLDWATARRYRQGDNPARWKGHLDKLLSKPSDIKKVKHHPALHHKEAGAFMAALRRINAVSARALEFCILTGTRSGEVREAVWAEIDLSEKVWTIPAGRMKAEKEHQVPLSDAAIKILKSIGTSTGGIFTVGGGRVLSDMTLTQLIRRMDAVREGGWRERGTGKVITVHGFRSTFRDWAGETTGYPREVIEHALSHQLKDKAEAAYARGTLFPKRRRLMADWANYCSMEDSGGAEVVPLRAAEAA